MFKDKLNEIVKDRGTNIYRVSKETQIPYMTLSDWAHGRSEPKYSNIFTIARHFDVKPGYFFDQ